jgi:hypothetical protein
MVHPGSDAEKKSFIPFQTPSEHHHIAKIYMFYQTIQVSYPAVRVVV